MGCSWRKCPEPFILFYSLCPFNIPSPWLEMRGTFYHFDLIGSAFRRFFRVLSARLPLGTQLSFLIEIENVTLNAFKTARSVLTVSLRSSCAHIAWKR